MDQLEATAAAVAAHSMQSIRDFLLVQPACHDPPQEQHNVQDTDRKSWVEQRAAICDSFFGPMYKMQGASWVEEKRRDDYKDWCWQHSVVPPTKMEISLILTTRGTQLGELSNFDHV